MFWDIPYLPQNTPGITYAAAYVMSVLVTCGLFGRARMNRAALVAADTGFAAMLVSLMMLTQGVSGFAFFAVMACVFAIVMLMIVINIRDHDLLLALYVFPFVLLLGETAASLLWQLYYYVAERHLLPPTVGTLLLFAAVVYALVFGIDWALVRRTLGDFKNVRVEKRDLVPSYLICAGAYLMSNSSYVLKDTPFSSSYPMEIYIMRTMADLGGIFLLVSSHLVLQSARESLENEMLRQAMQQQYENYQLSKESVELVNQKYHDLKHQLTLIRQGGVISDEAQAGLDQIERSVRKYEAENKTGNAILDTILTAKSLQCQGKDIEFKVVADGTALERMDDMDIAALFGNIIDNAIEACEKVTPDERLITLAVSKRKGFLSIREENRFAGELAMEHGTPVTTKGDKRFHGFGVKSIRSTVEEYKGDVRIAAEGGWFKISILIPLG